MRLSVAYNFDPVLLSELTKFSEVKEIFGKLAKDIIGGGRTAYTLKKISRQTIINTVNIANQNKISFNYLLNGSNFNNLEQTKTGQKKIRELLNFLEGAGIDNVTVSSPYLLRLIKAQHPKFKVKASAFAMVDSPEKAKQWQDLGADVICISAISCNRNFKTLRNIRNSVACDLQLIVNSSCLLMCAYELTHMNILTNSSRSQDINKGFCVDYCFINCSYKRLLNPIHFIKSTWIRPEDLKYYEELGYDNFKILERSSPTELLLKRVKSYADRTFDGNLLELVAPVAQIKKSQKASFFHRMRMMKSMFKPQKIKIKSLLLLKKYLEKIIIHDFSYGSSPVYIDNRSLDTFLPNLLKHDCESENCAKCMYCENTALESVEYDEDYRNETIKLAEELDKGLIYSSHWM